MQRFFLKILITTVNAFILAEILPGLHMDSFYAAILFGLVLSFLDAIIKPILVLLTLPVTILTLGTFLFVINTFMILISDRIIKEFSVDSFWHALLFSIILSFFNSFVHKKATPKKESNAK